MKKLLLLLLLLPVFAKAQFIYPGPYLDSTIFTFTASDSLTHDGFIDFYFNTVVSIDTSSATIWQIGNTLKPVFSNDTVAKRGIMTDTLNPYPVNANDFFVLKISNAVNCIIDFWHSYQTDSTHAGGTVEFSTDSTTWMNITACPGIATQNFYTTSDTLTSGLPAFTGTSNGQQLSRFQLLNCMAVRTTATSCFPDFEYGPNPIYIRFRFVSDSTPDSLSGWMINAIGIEFTGCGESTKNINNTNQITLSPNPATDNLTITSTNPITQATITNLLGQTIYSKPPAATGTELTIDVANLPPGLYFAQVNNTAVRKFVKE